MEHTRLDVPVGIRPDFALGNTFLRQSDLILHQRLSLDFPVSLVLCLPIGPHTLLPNPPSLALGGLALALSAGATVVGGHVIIVHGLQGLAHASEQHHQPPLGESPAVDQVRVDGILQVPPPEVGQQNVDGLVAGVGAVLRDDGMFEGLDDVLMGGEQRIGLDLFEGLRDGFLAKGTADLLQGVEVRLRRRLDEIDVGEATLFCEEKGKGQLCSVYMCMQFKGWMDGWMDGLLASFIHSYLAEEP